MARHSIQIRTPDGAADCTEHVPDGAGPFPAVLFFMDALGIRDAVRGMADRLATHGFYVLLPNLFYRSGAFAPFDPKTIWTDPAERARLGAIMGTLTPEAAMRDVGSYLDAIAANAKVKPGGVGCVGYCMGGVLAVRTAETYPDRVAAAAAIHPGHLVTDKPDSAHHAVDRIRARVYVGAADNDRSFTAEQRQAFEAALSAAGVRHQVELYSGKLHGFAVPDFTVYDAEAAELHWQRVLSLFDETLRSAAR